MRKRIFSVIAVLAFTLTGAGFFLGSPASATVSGQKVIVFMGENHSFSQVDGSSQAGYINGLASLYRLQTNYFATTASPSRPNYLDIAFGGHGSCTSDSYCTQSGRTVFGQEIDAGGSAKLYAQGMSSNCQTTNGTSIVPGSSEPYYAQKHNPWAAASNSTEAAYCSIADVPMGTTTSGALISDINNDNVPNVAMVVPDQCEDSHSCSLQHYNDFLQVWVPKIQATSSYANGNTLIVVNWDEGTSSSDKLYTVLIAKGTPPNGTETYGNDNTSLNHFSLSRLMSDVSGSGHLCNGAVSTSCGAGTATAFPK